MKHLLPPNSHSKTRHHARYLAGSCLILAGLTLAVTALKATNPSPHLPIVGWVPDQLVTVAGQGYATQYLQVIHDGSGVPSVDGSTNPSFYSTSSMDLEFLQCTTTDVTAGCADTTTGYKVIFHKTPAADGATSIRLAFTENGLTAYTAFTLRRNVAGVANPPTIQNLPSRVVLTSSVSHTVTYNTQFVVGDLDSGGSEDVCVNSGGSEDCSQGTTLVLNATSDNHMLLADSPSGVQLTLMPPRKRLVIMRSRPRP